MVKHIVDRQEVLMLIDLIEAPFVPLESKLKAIKRMEYITGRDLSGTKAFKSIRAAYLSGTEETLDDDTTMAKLGATKPKAKRMRMR